MLENKKFGVISLGCDKNRVDSEKLIGLLKERGCSLTDDLSQAEIVVVNTCAFLESAGYKKNGKLEKIVVTGCLPQKFIGELYDPLTEADVFLGIHDYEKIFEALEASYAGNERENYVGKGSDGFRAARVLTTWPHYAYLKIADGCYNHCTYCLIPKIRGKYVSYPMEDLLKEAENLGEVSELVVVAQDTTRYGEDLYGVNKFPELLHRLSLLENVRRIRLLYCYPDVIGDELIAEIRHNEKIVKYIDIPLQHSEDRVLKLMNRKGTRKSYLALIEKLRREIPDIAIRSTFISGFPTETEKEFEEMKAFLREAELVNCGFFAYSREPDTAAARMSPQVHPSTKRRRVRELYEMQREISKKLLSSFVGKELEVLCDGIDYEKNCFVGRAYFSAPEIDGRVYFHAREVMQGETYKVVINSADSYDLYGETEDYRS